LASLLRELLHVKPPVSASKLLILEQQYPGEAEPREEGRTLIK